MSHDTAAAARVLRAATDRHGRTMPDWSSAPVRAAERVLEVGPGILAADLPGRWVGVGPAAPTDERPWLRAVPTALPLATNAVDAVCLVLTLPWVTDMDAMFAEVRRVLRPAGTLVVVVPSVTVRSRAELQLARLLRPVRRGAWLNRSGLDSAAWLLTAADFAVMGDDRVPFTVPLPDAAAAINMVADAPAAGLWPDLPVAVRTSLADELVRRAGPDRVLPVPMRRLVARR